MDLKAIEKQKRKVAILKNQRIEATEKANEGKGEIGRAEYAPTRARLFEHHGELLKLRKPAGEVKKLGEDVLELGIVTGADRARLDFACRNLQGAAGLSAVTALEKCIDRIDSIDSDDPQVWPAKHFFAGALANLGAARECIETVLEIISEIPDVEPKPAKKAGCKPHPLAEAGAAEID